MQLSLATLRKDAKLLPLFKNVIPAFPGVANDIKKPGQDEHGYGKLPLKAAFQLQRGWAAVRADLAKVTCPVLYFRSRVDHVVEAVSGEILLGGLTGTQATEVILEDSYHVATLDNDAPLIFDSSVDFIKQHSKVASGA